MTLDELNAKLSTVGSRAAGAVNFAAGYVLAVVGPIGNADLNFAVLAAEELSACDEAWQTVVARLERTVADLQRRLSEADERRAILHEQFVAALTLQTRAKFGDGTGREEFR